MGLREQLKKLHMWNGWTAAGAIVGALTLLVGLLAWLYPQSPSAGSTPSTSSSAAPGQPSGAPDASPLSTVPTPTAPPAPARGAVIKRGTGTFTGTDRVNLETGEQGPQLGTYDVLYRPGENWQYISSPNGSVARNGGAITPKDCAEALKGYPVASDSVLTPSTWFCLETGAGHIAAIQVSATSKRFDPAPMNYLVWNATAAECRQNGC